MQKNKSCVIAENSKREVYAVIQFLQGKRVNQSEIYHRLKGGNGLKILSWKEVSVWCKKFKVEQTNLNHDPEKNKGRQGLHTQTKTV